MTQADGAAVRLAAQLPKNDANGLSAIAKTLVAEPQPLRYALIAYTVAQVIDDVEEGVDTAVIRVQRIEPIVGDFADRAHTLLADAARYRLGQLDFDGEESG